MKTIRNQAYLEARLSNIVSKYFPEINLNLAIICFGRRAKTRLGSIRPQGRSSIITINGLFKEEIIPEKIIDLTIAHELCHFVHGFSSSLPQLFDHPHKGGAVTNELRRRGLGSALIFQKAWLKSQWPTIVRANFKPARRRRRSRRGLLYFLTH